MGNPQRFSIFYQPCLAVGFFWRRDFGYPLTITLTLPLCGIEIGIGKEAQE